MTDALKDSKHVPERKLILSFPLDSIERWTRKLFLNGVGRCTFFTFTSQKNDTRFEVVLQRLNYEVPYQLVAKVILYAGDVSTIRRSSTILTKMMDETFGCLLRLNSPQSEKGVPYWGEASFHVFEEPGTAVKADLEVVLQQLQAELSESGIVDTCNVSFQCLAL